eukprot:TRINITY_DN13197_c0_g1_i1.p1 TRINITY_DN13197_c0_g1~~TRINITY_DN13197_c0_g1_i1.p1  ORF type:complete len:123 (+),score=13.68 TRINITY_DN13197_c0_g1_i1:149-517(+)
MGKPYHLFLSLLLLNLGCHMAYCGPTEPEEKGVRITVDLTLTKEDLAKIIIFLILLGGSCICCCLCAAGIRNGNPFPFVRRKTSSHEDSMDNNGRLLIQMPGMHSNLSGRPQKHNHFVANCV